MVLFLKDSGQMAIESNNGELIISWPHGRYDNDHFPKGFFSEEVKDFKRSHDTSAGKKRGKATCILTIKGNVATLRYPKVLNAHDPDIDDGELTICFKDKSRNVVSRIDFLDSKGNFQENAARSNWPDIGEVLEGRRSLTEVQYISRNATLMRQKKAEDNYRCEACGYCVEFKKGQFIIDCHHKDPVAMGERETVMSDLHTLCPNCHRIAHTSEKPLSLAKIKAVLRKAGLPVAKG